MALSIRFPKLALAAALAVAAGTAAFADSDSSEVTAVQPNPLVVTADGQNYTTLKTLGNVSIQAHVKYDTGVTGRIVSWSVSPLAENAFGPANPVLYIADYKVSKSYAIGDRPKSMDKYVVMQVPASKFAAASLDMCNQKAEALRAQGKTNNQIFAYDHEVAFKVSVDFKVVATGTNMNPVPSPILPSYFAKVVCKKRPPTAPRPSANGLANPFGVKKAILSLKEVATQNGTCMVKLKTDIITNTGGVTLQYRYVHSSGKKSKVFSAKTKSTGTAEVSNQWAIPNEAGTESGWMQLVGVSHDYKSNKAVYIMHCKDKAPGGLAPNPKKPKVAVPLGGTGLKSN